MTSPRRVVVITAQAARSGAALVEPVRREPDTDVVLSDVSADALRVGRTACPPIAASVETVAALT